MTASKDMLGSSMKLPDFGGVEPPKSRLDTTFWRLSGMTAIAYNFGRVGVMVGIIGLGFGLWKDYQLSWYVANRPTQVFVGERDANNNIKPMFGADRVYSPQLADIETFLREWIKDARWLTPDKVLMGNNVTEAFNSLDDKPKAELSEHYRLNHPNALVDQGISRSIEPLGASLISPNSNTYRLEWLEYQIEGARALTPVRRGGNFVIVHRQPKSQEEFTKNPSGLWVTHIDAEVFRIPAGVASP